MKSRTNLILLVITILFSGCASFEYGTLLYDHRGDLMSLNTKTGKRFYDVYFDHLFFTFDAPVAKAHFQKYGFPDYIYCEGQFSNYLIYSNDQLKIFHFEQTLMGPLVIKLVTSTELPYTAQTQLKQVSLAKQQKLNYQLQRQQQIDRQKLEERWRNEYLQELSEPVN